MHHCICYTPRRLNGQSLCLPKSHRWTHTAEPYHNAEQLHFATYIPFFPLLNSFDSKIRKIIKCKIRGGASKIQYGSQLHFHFYDLYWIFRGQTQTICGEETHSGIFDLSSIGILFGTTLAMDVPLKTMAIISITQPESSTIYNVTIDIKFNRQWKVEMTCNLSANITQRAKYELFDHRLRYITSYIFSMACKNSLKTT